MEKDQSNQSPRRKFLGTVAAGAAAIGLSTFVSPLAAHAGKFTSPGNDHTDPMDPDAWFDKVKGKHRIVYDVTGPKEGHDLIMPFAWSRIFLLTNGNEKDCGVVMICRHAGIPFMMEDRLWKKYKLGDMFKINDPGTGLPSMRNMMWKPNPAFTVPGVGPVPIGIDELQASGVMFCVCNMALTVFSAIVADQMKMTKEEVYKDWVSGLLPNVQIVPSGVWAVGRAQEHKCGYCFAG